MAAKKKGAVKARSTRRKGNAEDIARLYGRAWFDDDFRQRMRADAAGVLREAGIMIPHGVRVYIHENTEMELHFVIPVKPRKGVSEYAVGTIELLPFPAATTVGDTDRDGK